MRNFVRTMLVVATVAWAGCVNVKAPERIDVGGSPVYGGSHRSSRPEPQTLSEAREELRRAYDRIDSLEHKVAGLESDKRKLKDERDDYKDRYKQARKERDN
ncbi:MAG: hypothetical protein U1A27_02005 [Phycisphaerae bacterium]